MSNTGALSTLAKFDIQDKIYIHGNYTLKLNKNILYIFFVSRAKLKIK